MPPSIDADASPKSLVYSGHGDHTKAANHSVKMAKNEDEIEPNCDTTATVDSISIIELVNCYLVQINVINVRVKCLVLEKTSYIEL